MKYAILALALSLLACESASAVVVVLGTKFGGKIGGMEYNEGDLVRYNTETDEASIFLSNSSFDDNIPFASFDALDYLNDDEIVFSSVGFVSINGERYRGSEVVKYNLVSEEVEVLLSIGADISGVAVLPNGNLLLAAKWDTTVLGHEYLVGDILLYDPDTESVSTFFSSSNFYTVNRPKSGIDAIDILPNGNLLFSTTNESDIGTSDENAFFVEQEGVYEYDFLTGSVSTFLDPSVFQSNSDLKAFSVISVPEPSSFGVGVIAVLVASLRRARTRNAR